MNLKKAFQEVLYSLRPLRKENAKLRQQLAIAEKKISDIESQRRAESDENRRLHWVPVGHFYSPIPAIEDIEADHDNIFDIPPAIRGVKLNEKHQLEMLDEFRKFYPEQPFPETKAPNRRYFFQNPNYQYTDALVLYSMIRHLRPHRIIEVGSGYSSCAMLDVNELFFDNSIQCTFIDPYPQLLQSLIKDTDIDRIQILGQKVQDVDAKLFRTLGPSDILFIDSSHLSKTASDVNYILFKILPLLNAGVHIHFHDIHFPFEYPEDWIYEGRSWNETYFLRAFLQYNSTFDIEFFSTYLLHFHRELFELHMPLCLLNHGGNLWLKKTKLDTELDRIAANIERKARMVPSKIHPTRAAHRWLLKEGWHESEKRHCWIANRAVFRIAGPVSRGQLLRLRVYNTHSDGALISATADNAPLRPAFVSQLGASTVEFELPESVVGKSPIQVELSVDKTFTPPDDPRELAIAIIEIEVC